MLLQHSSNCLPAPLHLRQYSPLNHFKSLQIASMPEFLSYIFERIFSILWFLFPFLLLAWLFNDSNGRDLKWDRIPPKHVNDHTKRNQNILKKRIYLNLLICRFNVCASCHRCVWLIENTSLAGQHGTQTHSSALPMNFCSNEKKNKFEIFQGRNICTDIPPRHSSHISIDE